MREQITNIHDAEFESDSSPQSGASKTLDLSGKRLGVRIEEIPPGGTSSIHHYHTLEEEHVLVIEGTGTLILGSQERALKPGDHIWFEAGVAVAHHIENRSSDNLKYLVFGERNEGDIVYYPENRVMMVKAPSRALFTYRPFTLPARPAKS